MASPNAWQIIIAMGIGRQHQDVNNAQEKLVCNVYSVGMIDAVEKVNAMGRIISMARINASAHNGP